MSEGRLSTHCGHSADGRYWAVQFDDNDEFRWFFRFGPLAFIPAIAGFLYFAPSPPEAPANTTVFGCYSAPDSPSIRLDAAGMHILQSGFPVIGYHLERHKTGIALTADAPIRADRIGVDYRFGMNRRGIGWFLPFYREGRGHTYGVFDPALLESFQMLATDGRSLNYSPAAEANCATA